MRVNLKRRGDTGKGLLTEGRGRDVGFAKSGFRPTLLIALAAQDVSTSETIVALATKNYKGIIVAVHRPGTRRNLLELDKAPVASVSAAQPEVVANGR